MAGVDGVDGVGVVGVVGLEFLPLSRQMVPPMVLMVFLREREGLTGVLVGSLAGRLPSSRLCLVVDLLAMGGIGAAWRAVGGVGLVNEL